MGGVEGFRKEDIPFGDSDRSKESTGGVWFETTRGRPGSRTLLHLEGRGLLKKKKRPIEEEYKVLIRTRREEDSGRKIGKGTR